MVYKQDYTMRTVFASSYVFVYNKALLLFFYQLKAFYSMNLGSNLEKSIGNS